MLYEDNIHKIVYKALVIVKLFILSISDYNTKHFPHYPYRSFIVFSLTSPYDLINPITGKDIRYSQNIHTCLQYIHNKIFVTKLLRRDASFPE